MIGSFCWVCGGWGGHSTESTLERPPISLLDLPRVSADPSAGGSCCGSYTALSQRALCALGFKAERPLTFTAKQSTEKTPSVLSQDYAQQTSRLSAYSPCRGLTVGQMFRKCSNTTWVSPSSNNTRGKRRQQKMGAAGWYYIVLWRPF